MHMTIVFSDPIWKEEDVPHKQDDSHIAQRQNDLDLIHHNDNQM